MVDSINLDRVYVYPLPLFLVRFIFRAQHENSRDGVQRIEINYEWEPDVCGSVD